VREGMCRIARLEGDCSGGGVSGAGESCGDSSELMSMAATGRYRVVLSLLEGEADGDSARPRHVTSLAAGSGGRDGSESVAERERGRGGEQQKVGERKGERSPRQAVGASPAAGAGMSSPKANSEDANTSSSGHPRRPA
jgi:hypothetical protein